MSIIPSLQEVPGQDLPLATAEEWIHPRKLRVWAAYRLLPFTAETCHGFVLLYRPP